MAAVLILSFCCLSLLTVGLAKLYHYYQPAHQHTALADPNADLDTLSSRGSASLAGHEFLQLEPSSEPGPSLEGHYGRVVKSVTPRQPRGILKQSRTSENLSYCASSSLTLYSNPALEPHGSPLRLQDPETMIERQMVSTLATATLERSLGSSKQNWQAADSSDFLSEAQGSLRLLSDPQEPGGCQRVSQTSLLCLRESEGLKEREGR